MYFYYRLDKLFSRLAIHNHPYSLGAAQNESYATSLFVLSQHPPAQHHMMIMNVEEVAHRWTEEREKLTWPGSIGIRAQMPVLLRCRLADSLWEREKEKGFTLVLYIVRMMVWQSWFQQMEMNVSTTRGVQTEYIHPLLNPRFTLCIPIAKQWFCCMLFLNRKDNVFTLKSKFWATL